MPPPPRNAGHKPNVSCWRPQIGPLNDLPWRRTAKIHNSLGGALEGIYKYSHLTWFIWTLHDEAKHERQSPAAMNGVPKTSQAPLFHVMSAKHIPGANTKKNQFPIPELKKNMICNELISSLYISF